MANIRIHELAKELQVDSKEILTFVNKKGIEAKSTQKSLEPELEEQIRKAFGKKPAVPVNDNKPEAPAPKSSAVPAAKKAAENTSGEKPAAGEEKPKKKKRLIAVFRPQNASSKEGRSFRQASPQQPRPADRRRRPDENRAGGQTAAQKTPLVRVPRPHPVIRGEENKVLKRQAQAQMEKKRPIQETPVPEEIKPVETVVPAAAPVEQPAAHPAPEKPVEQARPAAPVKPAAGSRPAPVKENRGPRTENRGPRPEKSGQRPNRPAGGIASADRQKGGLQGKSRAQVPVPDVSTKKPGRDTGHNKDKDKRELRENKLSGDRRNNRGGNQKQMIPKALQKPAHRPKEEKKEVISEIRLPEKMTIRELAEAMKMQPSQIVKDLFMKGEMYTVNQEIDFDKAEEIALGYDIVAEMEEKVDVIAEMLKEDEEDESKLVSRPPVVCVMGHVDHGKTSLLDAIRHAHVTDREAGGITQNIGAYSVRINDRKITFLDTPGHEAFTAMRMRGANSTDIAILVVAADDGVMPQTVEAIHHAKAAGVEIVVAINKIDKPGANIDRVKQELIEHELVPVDWGGSTEFVPVSAKTKEGIDDLLETVLLTADIMELKANPKRKARGLVLEARLDKGKGTVVSILVQKGTLHVGDYIACGAASGRVRAMMDENGKRVKEARPSTPVEVLGLSDVPNAGEILVALDSDREAKEFAATFISENRNKLLEETKSRMSLDALFSQMQEGTLKELKLVVKADVQGSVEALKQSLLKLSNEEVMVRIIHSGVGAISESEITLAAASDAIVIGFNVRPDAVAKTMGDQEKIDIRLYDVIYQAIDDIEAAMKGLLEPVYEEKIIGHAEVRQLFKASGVGTIAGSYILDGMIQRGCKVRITREGKQIFEGDLASLKRFKDDVKEVKAGYECGLVFNGFNELKEMDQVEAYIMVEVPRN